jgi:selenide, water dikinase
MSSIPIIANTEMLVSKGVRSSLYASNAEQISRISNVLDSTTDTITDILFDPQTAGGLLFATHPTNVTPILVDLRAAGYTESNVIGVITDRNGIELTGL